MQLTDDTMTSGMAAANYRALQFPLAPRTIDETGLDLLFLVELLCKILFRHGRLSVAAMSACTKLPFSVLSEVFDFMRAEHLCELRRHGESSTDILYELAHAGRVHATEALQRCQYTGPAPVTLDAYAAQVQRQSIRNVSYTRAMMAAGFEGLVMQENVLDRLGAGMNSDRAIILYGPPGSGKSYIAEHLACLLSDDIAIPYAIVVDGEIIQVFDSHIHQPRPQKPDTTGSLGRGQSTDARWIRCRRPTAITGGELTLQALDLDFDEGSRTYQAPPQVKANNGVFVVDDLGRQMVSAEDLMNRWIVPLDRRRDYLTLRSGYKFQVPFDVTVVFSSNHDPAQLADEAFLRRIGYKIRIGPLTEQQYRTVFRRVCEELDIPFSEAALTYLLQERHYAEGRPLLACYPRDLLGQVRDKARYEGRPPALTPETIDWAWSNYFVPHDPSPPFPETNQAHPDRSLS